MGKTETLREFCKGKQHVFYSCTQSTDKVQLSKFSKHILKEDIPAKKYISEFASFTFEDVCKEFVKELQKKNELPFRYSKMGRWVGKTTVRDKDAPKGVRVAETEIDILGIGKDGKEYLVGEYKFKNTPFDYSAYLDTATKLTPLKDSAKFYYALFSESGFDDKVVSEADNNDNIMLYSLNQIVNYK